MTRDRPASGGQDSTLEGEFPSDFGGGGKRVEPKKIAEVRGGTIKQSGLVGNEAGLDYNQLSTGYVGGSPVMAINDSPIGGTLSGVYQFSSIYFVKYTFAGTGTADPTVAPGAVLSVSKVVNATDQHPGGFLINMGAGPSGNTGTLNPGDVSFTFSVTGLTATHFGTYDLPTFAFGNAYPIATDQAFSHFLNFSIGPAYPFEWIRSNRRLDYNAVVPNSNTSFTVNATAELSANAGTGATIDISMEPILFTSFNTTAYSYYTITSSL